jgi:fatty-acyl-CoA synthase
MTILNLNAMNFASIWEMVSDLVGERPAVKQGARSVLWRDYENHASRLATAFVAAGLKPDSKVGLYLYNSPEYCETNFAAMKFGGIPINVNYRYLEDELRYLLDNADCEAVVFHTSLGDRIARVMGDLPQLKLLIEVDDGPASDGITHRRGVVKYNEVLAKNEPMPRRTPTGSEMYILYTGGTTGMPKGVMYSMPTLVEFLLRTNAAVVGLPTIDSAEQLLQTVASLCDVEPVVAMSGPPLMHGTGGWLGMMVPHLFGGTACLLEQRSFDPIEVWSVVERNRVQRLIIVGDAFARPLLRAFDAEPGRWDASSLRVIVSSGAMFSAEVKQGLFEYLPECSIADVLGSTEGSMGQSITNKTTSPGATARFSVSRGAKVFTEDGREVEPGSGEVGMVASSGLVPIAYYKDPEKSERTFREVNGVRYSFPGDMARVAADGSLELLGRGSNCINTGGEKVFPEEVEEALKQHPAVEDALVFGIPDERFGNRIVGVISLSAGTVAIPDEVIIDTKKRLSSYKVPRALHIVEYVPRAPNGKADYVSARALFDEAT